MKYIIIDIHVFQKEVLNCILKCRTAIKKRHKSYRSIQSSQLYFTTFVKFASYMIHNLGPNTLNIFSFA